jgi:DNA-directed RNA polymerase specialized sigma24 family protein
MSAHALTILEILPRLRLQARLWTHTQEQADDIVGCCLELAIKAVPEFEGDDVEAWLSELLLIARQRMGKPLPKASAYRPLR